LYQALYRKWRPKTFDQVVGQPHITETLKSQIINDRLSHAYLFIGTRGTGKTTCAKILAKAVNCENPVNGNPCCKCPSCLGIEDGTIMDVVELDAASNNGVDNVRALRDEAIYSPASVKKRVYIVDEVHMLSTSAFNALLKILEEPPEHLMFILATTELNKVPATILSRCQRHSFKRLSSELISEHLEHIAKEENFSLTKDAADLIARICDGGMRDALSILDQCSATENVTLESVYSAMGLAGTEGIFNILSAIINKDTSEALEQFNTMWSNGKDPSTMLNELSTLERDVLLFISAPKAYSKLVSGTYSPEQLNRLALNLTSAEIISQMNTIQEYLTTMKTAGNPKMISELCLISLCEPEIREGIPELRGRVSKIEKAISSGSISVKAVQSPNTEPAPIEKKPEITTPNLKAESAAPKKEPAPIPDKPVEMKTEDIPPFDDYEYPPIEEPPPVGKALDIPPWEAEVPKAEPVQSEEPVEDDIDPEQFKEFQPEDDFLDRDSSSGDEWTAISKRAETLLPPGIRIYLSEPDDIKGSVEGDLLKLQVSPGFIFETINTQENLLAFRQAANDVLGKPVQVIISEMNNSNIREVTRDIEELRQFKEVHITGGH